jgi:Carboxypeptidase regulatory-like domain
MFRAALVGSVAFVIGTVMALGADALKPDVKGGAAEAATTAKNPSLIDIALTISQKQTVAGNGIGVTGKITNDSTKPVYLKESDTVLTLPPELQNSQEVVTWYAYFPTEVHGEKVSPMVVIQPQDSYDVAWVPHQIKGAATEQHHGILSEWWSHIKDEMTFLWFTPGDYTLVVQTKYYSDDPDTTKTPYRTFQREIVVPTAAPELVILFGAALGGLIAFIIFPATRRTYLDMATDTPKATRSLVRASARFVFSLAIVMLLSAIVTILLSRVAQTQFPIKVTVNDVWGAIAIGFVAAYLGTQWLDKLIKSGSGTPPGNAGTITVTGTVTDKTTTKPIQGAIVKASGQSATSAADGKYGLAGVSAGTITLTVECKGYQAHNEVIAATASGGPYDVQLQQ